MIGELSNHLWQSTVFAIVAGILTVAFRKNRAHVRYWLWLTASLKFLIPFALLMTLGTSLWSILPTRKIPTEIAPPAVSLTVVEITQPFPSAVTFASAAQHRTNWLPAIALCVWAFGFAAIVLMRFRGWLRIRAAVRASSPIDITSAVPVRSSLGLLEPGVVGFLRPTLLLPEGILKTLTPPQLKAVLAHELSHVRRRDNLTAALHMIVEAIFWFHPLVWWIGARLVEERERACDEAVLSLGSEARDYAESILRVCEFYVESPLTCVSGVTGSDLKKRVGRIMRNQIGDALGAWRKVLLAAAGVAALAVPIFAGALIAPRLRTQAPADQFQEGAANRPKFDAASIKPDTSGDPMMQANLAQTGGHFVATNYTLRLLILVAYNLPITLNTRSTVLGAPNWADSEHFDIEAEAEGNLSRDQKLLMLQSLLAERFKLVVHHETRQLPVYALVQAKAGKTGSQLQPHSDDTKCYNPASGAPSPVGSGDPIPMPCGGFRVEGGPLSRLAGGNVTTQILARTLSYTQGIDRAVVDRSGLSGTFDIRLDWTRQSGQAAAADSDPSAPPNIFTALQEQLGLKLEPTTGPVDILVIDHVEQPSDNSAASAEEPPKSPAVPQWQTAAGGKMAFDVASVKRNISGNPSPISGQPGASGHTNIPMGPGDDFPANGGLFSAANYPLTNYIMFAYKLTVFQRQLLVSQMPKGSPQGNFDIEAHAPQRNLTKDQMRLMMQSLLSDRFKLVVHFETRQLPVFALVLDKPGKLGPQIRPHSDNQPCTDIMPPPGLAPTPSDGLPSICDLPSGMLARLVSGHLHVSIRKISIGQLVGYFPAMGNLDRPVLDQTGLSGNFDFSVVFTQESNGPTPPDVQADSSAPTFLEALKEQLGLKLEPTIGPEDVLVVDHVEEPSPN